jgi:hypothetical protein
MSRATPLPVIEVEQPCHEDWKSMSGDERARFCAQCGQHVHDLSAMRSDEVVDLVCRNAGRLCVRLERTSDGQVRTLDYEPTSATPTWRARAIEGIMVLLTILGLGFVILGPMTTRTMGVIRRVPPRPIGPTALPAQAPAAPSPVCP